MPKVATGAAFQKNSMAEMMAASDFSFGTWNFQRPSKFGHILNNRNKKGSKGDQAGVCGATSPVQCQKWQLELFFKRIRRRR
jgi:hypothetical protein